MKIELAADDRRHLYNVLRYVALSLKDNPEAAAFWIDLSRKLGPNQAVIYLRRPQAKFLLTIAENAVKSIIDNDAYKQGDEPSVKAQVLKAALERAISKIKPKLGEGENG